MENEKVIVPVIIKILVPFKSEKDFDENLKTMKDLDQEVKNDEPSKVQV